MILAYDEKPIKNLDELTFTDWLKILHLNFIYLDELCVDEKYIYMTFKFGDFYYFTISNIINYIQLTADLRESLLHIGYKYISNSKLLIIIMFNKWFVKHWKEIKYIPCVLESEETRCWEYPRNIDDLIKEKINNILK